MISAGRPVTVAEVADHYDELDLAYRLIWGEQVHHGYWRAGDENPAQATANLAWSVGDLLAPEAGQTLCDIGCGYGETAALLAARYKIRVIGLSISPVQAERGRAKASPDVEVLCRDWLDNGLSDATFDHAYAIESSEHMVDKQRFFTEAWRVLKPGGRLVVCAWLEGHGATPWQVRHLLEPICAEGRLPGMGSKADYTTLAEVAGFRLVAYRDLSREVRKTWSICLGRLLHGMATTPAIRQLALRAGTRNRDFILSIPRLIWAYRTGAMEYGVFAWEKPG